MYWQPLIFVAYVATMPFIFLAFAAIEIKIHPDKYKDQRRYHHDTRN